ncbi:uncharacterized protein LOC114714055 [Neltuma alba]|uniref:uncharacterized protein LOC114714055 n=1 Tax=Neltuma alba TaxID=207710 RepID=UPI0010A4C4A0|nr:uncharacterized protein LOC114714055 [Prosopis alba]
MATVRDYVLGTDQWNEWLTWNTRHKPGRGRFGSFEWMQVLSWICWLLWNARCKYLFDGATTTHKDILQRCLHHLMEYTSHQKLKHKIFCLDLEEEEYWTPPPSNSVRIDVDGSVKTNSQAACGGTIRNNGGEWITGFTRYIGVGSVIEAELEAIKTGLEIGRGLGYGKIQLYIDSIEAFNILMRDGMNGHPLQSLVNEVRELIYANWDVEISYTSRETIRCADYMAKMGHQTTYQTMLVPSTPHFCRQIIAEDEKHY